MEALSTFIKLYILSLIVILIPAENTTDRKISTDIEFETIEDSFNFPTIVFDDAPLTNKNVELESKPSNEIVNIAINDVTDLEAEIDFFQFPTQADTIESSTQFKSDFWATLYSIESKEGRLMYRPSNKNKNCKTTASPCGHHQLSLQALKDISCASKQCMKDRENYEKSLAMSKKLHDINSKRVKRSLYGNLPDYQKYLIHQQGAAGLKIILAASHGDKLLPKMIKKNMAGNSPYSYKKLNKLGSKQAAKSFLSHWNKKWEHEKRLVTTLNKLHKSNKESNKINPKLNLPTFNDYELQIALNLIL